IYASGQRQAYRRCIPILEGFARAHFFLGPFGAGSKMKFLANLLVAIHNVSTAEAFVLGLKAGLDPATIIKVLGEGAGSSRMLQIRGPMMVRNDYREAMMKVSMWQKDMRIIADFARELDCPTPLFATTSSIYNAAMAQGFAAADTASVCAVLEKWARTRRTSSGAPAWRPTSACSLYHATCGVRMTFSRPRSGCGSGKGSGSVVSSAQPAIFFASSARTS